MKVRSHHHWYGWYGAKAQNWSMHDERKKWLFTVQLVDRLALHHRWMLICNGPAGCINDLAHDVGNEDALFLLGLSRDEAREQVEKVYGAIHVG